MTSRRTLLAAPALAGVLAATLTGCSSTPPGASRASAAPVRPAALPASTVVPPGWQQFRSEQVHLLLATPPDWTVDDSGREVGELVLFGSPAEAGLIVVLTSAPLPASGTANAAVLHSRAVSFATRGCEVGRRVLGTSTQLVAGLAFSVTTASCSAEEEEPGQPDDQESVLYDVGTAVHGGRVITFVCRSDADEHDEAMAERFGPLLRSLVL